MKLYKDYFYFIFERHNLKLFYMQIVTHKLLCVQLVFY